MPERDKMTTLRKMLSDQQAPYIQALMRQMETQSKKTLARWAVDEARGTILPLWNRHFAGDSRPQIALDAADAWLRGAIKLPEAKGHILACHQAAREAEGHPAAQAAARAIGQCASAIHSARHAIGLALYGALAIAYDRLGTGASWAELEGAAALECARMPESLHAVSVENEKNPSNIVWHC
jgi:hypothetical protein